MSLQAITVNETVGHSFSLLNKIVYHTDMGKAINILPCHIILFNKEERKETFDFYFN